MPPISLCWICGSNPADSSEHWLKASNVRNYFRHSSQRNPLHLHRDWKPYTKIASAKSRQLKFEPSICRNCNSSRTQPYDEAWDTLFDYLRTNWRPLLGRGAFDTSKAFPANPNVGAQHVHLFFAKLYGCLIRELGIAVDLNPFSRAVYHGIPNPDLQLAICNDKQSVERPFALRSEIHAWGQPGGGIDGTVWLYLFRPIGVKVFYRKPGAPLRPMARCWAPEMPIVKINREL